MSDELLNSGMLWILFFISVGITLLAQLLVKTRYNKYKQIENKIGMSGEEVARRILDNNGLQNVQICRIDKELGDNYNPTNKTVNQDKENYSFMRVRMKMIPLLNAASTLSYISIVIGLIAGYGMMLEIAIIVQIITMLFELVTLPVEFNASNRALKQLREFNLFSNDEVGGATSMLKACALTYVGALATTLVQVLRLVLMLQNSRGRRR